MKAKRTVLIVVLVRMFTGPSPGGVKLHLHGLSYTILRRERHLERTLFYYLSPVIKETKPVSLS